MRTLRTRGLALFILSLLCAQMAPAQELVDQVALVANPANASAPVPSAQTFTVSAAGSYTVTLTDLMQPTALASVSVLVASSEASVANLSASGSATVMLQPNVTYTVQPLGTAASGSNGGSLSVQVAPAGGAAVWQYAWTIPPPATVLQPGQSDLQTEFTVPAMAAGSYQLTITDQSFPAALSSLQLLILPMGSTTPVTGTPVSGPNISEAISLSAGTTYQLFIVAKADSTALAGLYSVSIQGGPTNASVYGAVVPVGQLPTPVSVNFTAGSSTALQITNLQQQAAPALAPLASLRVLIAEGSSILLPASGAGSYAISPTVGTAQVYSIAQPDATSGVGAFEASFTQGTTAVADVTVPVLASGKYGYDFSTTVHTAGSYSASVTGFSALASFGSLNGYVVQDGAIAGSLGAGGTTSTNISATAGPLSVLVFPTLTSPTADSLMYVAVSAQGSTTPIYSATQGVGAQFSSQSVSVPSAGNFGMTFTDLSFPASFGQIAVILTNGSTVVAEIVDTPQVSSGQVKLSNLAAGTYIVNILSSVNSQAGYGSYGLNISAVPTVTLTAAASSVTSGQSTTLTWTSTNASSCTASGGWSGALDGSGSQSTGALTSATSFTLTCTGPGGTAAQTVQVSIAMSTSSHGGGGTLYLWVLLALGGCTLARLLLVWRGES